MTDIRSYAGPRDPSAISWEDVFEALLFLIALEPSPDDDSIESVADYEAHQAPWKKDIAHAERTLRDYAMQRQPMSLSAMQEDYYDFIRDDCFDEADDPDTAHAVASSALSETWSRVGPWAK